MNPCVNVTLSMCASAFPLISKTTIPSYTISFVIILILGYWNVIFIAMPFTLINVL